MARRSERRGILAPERRPPRLVVLDSSAQRNPPPQPATRPQRQRVIPRRKQRDFRAQLLASRGNGGAVGRPTRDLGAGTADTSDSSSPLVRGTEPLPPVVTRAPQKAACHPEEEAARFPRPTPRLSLKEMARRGDRRGISAPVRRPSPPGFAAIPPRPVRGQVLRTRLLFLIHPTNEPNSNQYLPILFLRGEFVLISPHTNSNKEA